MVTESLSLKKFKSNVKVFDNDVLVYEDTNYKTYGFKDALARVLLDPNDRIGYIKVGASIATPTSPLLAVDLVDPYDFGLSGYTGGVGFGRGIIWTKDLQNPDDFVFTSLAADQTVFSSYYNLIIRYTPATQRYMEQIFEKYLAAGMTVKIPGLDTVSVPANEHFIIRSAAYTGVGEYQISVFAPDASTVGGDLNIEVAKPQYGRGDYYIVGNEDKYTAIQSFTVYDALTYQIQANTVSAHNLLPGDLIFIRTAGSDNSAWPIRGEHTVVSISSDRKSFVIALLSTIFPAVTAADMSQNALGYGGSANDIEVVTSFSWFKDELLTKELVYSTPSYNVSSCGTGLDYGEFGLYSQSGILMARFALPAPAPLTKNADSMLTVVWKYNISF